MERSEKVNIENSLFFVNGDAADEYRRWDPPTVIISDGPYGVNGFKGDLLSNTGLDGWYEPHIKIWSEISTPLTTLWFWNTELGWATVHPVLEKYGWEFKACHSWDKGMSHVAGNTNTKTIRHLPVVTEVCVQYTKKPVFFIDGKPSTMKDWLRHEWHRTGLPFSKTNAACGVVDAATRKYFTKCHLWYMPPPDAFEKIAAYANEHGAIGGKPFFSVDGARPMTGEEWAAMRAKFKCPMGVTNVWSIAQLRGDERLKNNMKAIHLNQKPLELISRIIEMSSDEGDVIWDPFAGLFTSAIASWNLMRKCYSAEINPDVFRTAMARVRSELNKPSQCILEDVI